MPNKSKTANSKVGSAASGESSSTSVGKAKNKQNDFKLKSQGLPPDVQLLQFKLTLLGHEPTVWRRFQITSNADFWDFHWAIQDMMDWTDEHLFRFRVRNPANGSQVLIGKPLAKPGFWYIDEAILDMTEQDSAKMEQSGLEPYGKAFSAWKVKVGKYFNEKTVDSGYEIEYIYDFGDLWKMELVFEGVFPLTDRDQLRYVALGGEYAAPPQDCGSYIGFQELLSGLKKVEEQEAAGKAGENEELTIGEKEKVDWVYEKKPDYNPKIFDPKKVVFKEAKNPLMAHRMMPFGFHVENAEPGDNRRTMQREICLVDQFYGRPKGTFMMGGVFTQTGFKMRV